MSDKNCAGVGGCNPSAGEAVCVHTNKVYDQCKSKECIRDLRVFLTVEGQKYIDCNAVSVKPREAELLYVGIDVEKVPFNRGFYSVDIRYFYKITVEVSTPVGRPQIFEGLAVYDKRTILYGSEGGARIFSSNYVPDAIDCQLQQRTNLPKAVVEVVEPILLEAKIVSPVADIVCCCGCITEVPAGICGCFNGEEICLHEGRNQLLVTLGQFSIIKLEREVQLLMPCYDVCMPCKDCTGTGTGGETEDPCEVFSRFDFPVDEFFPPKNDTPYGCGCDNGCNTCDPDAGVMPIGGGTTRRSGGCGCKH